MDNELLEVHAKADEEMNLLATDLRREQEELPKDVHAIFAEIRNVSVKILDRNSSKFRSFIVISNFIPSFKI